jgi:hypothetical protein
MLNEALLTEGQTTLETLEKKSSTRGTANPGSLVLLFSLFG